MEYQPSDYQPLEIKKFPAKALRETAEGKYWRRFRAPIVTKQVIMFNGQNRQVGRTFSRFKDTATSGVFRSDGKLIGAGGIDGVVQVFDANSRSALRQFKAHKRPVHVVRWSPDKLHLLSGSDDVTVRWWDLTTGMQLCRLDGHADYVRAAAGSPVNAETWATGGYDHIVKLWDIRTNHKGGNCTMNIEHGAPVEDVAFFSSGSMLVTAGGNQVCIWDLVGGGRLLKKLTNFQKTVTCVKFSPLAGPDSQAAPRLLTGSLDGHVKVIELDNFKVTHASRYPAPILSLGMSPDCGTLAVGMADGTLVVRKHDRPKAITAGPSAQPTKRQHYKGRLTAENFRYFIRGQNERAAANDYVVAARRKVRLQSFDSLLKKFRHRDALTAALETGKAEVISTVVTELASRGALPQALGGRDAAGLLPLLRFLVRNVSNPRHTTLVCGLAHRILDAYAPVVGLSTDVDKQLAALRDIVAEELQVQGLMMQIQGCLEPMLAASLGGLSIIA